MPGIRDPKFLSAIEDPYPYPHEKESYCQSCHKVGVKSPLQKRMYRFNDKTKQAEIITDSDQDKFRQCYNCGDVVPIYQVKYEAKITDFIETTDNPFDYNPGNMDTFGQSPSQSVGLKKYKYKRRIHKDPEIQEFLDKGNEVTNINESL